MSNLEKLRTLSKEDLVILCDKQEKQLDLGNKRISELLIDNAKLRTGYVVVSKTLTSLSEVNALLTKQLTENEIVWQE